MVVHAKVYRETMARMSMSVLEVTLYLMAEHVVMEMSAARVAETRNGVE